MKEITILVDDGWEEGNNIHHYRLASEPRWREVLRSVPQRCRAGDVLSVKAPNGYEFTATHDGTYILTILADENLNTALYVVEEGKRR
jgi:hypothetical protein